MSNFATTARPRWAVTSWVDHNNIYVEIPIKNQAPFVAKYPLTAEGLGLALGQMKKFHTIEAGPPQYIVPPRVVANAGKYSNDTRSKALAILRKHGIL